MKPKLYELEVILDGLKIVLNRLEVLYIQSFTNEVEWDLAQIEVHLKYKDTWHQIACPLYCWYLRFDIT